MESDADKLKCLAIDPASACGWAHSDGASGVWDFSVRPDESGGMRLLRFRAKLEEIRDSVGVDIVFFEASRNLKYGNAVRLAAELQGTLKVWCEDNKIEYIGYSPGEIKKFAVGKGNAGKEPMMQAARERWPDVNIIDDNHADALWILAFGQSRLGL